MCKNRKFKLITLSVPSAIMFCGNLFFVELKQDAIIASAQLVLETGYKI
jgi:uncharacterized membrane protein YukC